MFGLIGKLISAPGKRDDVMALIRSGSGEMPGCMSYVIAADAADPDIIWITEVWETEADHQRSLQLPSVREAIEKARPYLVGGESIARTVPHSR